MPRVKLFNEEEVLKKAMELFWKRGYHATSVQDLVDYLGINRASLYDTFGGKKELFEKTVEAYIIKTDQEMKNFLESQPSVKAGLKKLFQKSIAEVFDDQDKKGCFLVNCTTEIVSSDPMIQERLKANKTIKEEIFYSFLMSGVEKGELPKGKDYKALAVLLFTINNGLNVVTKLQSGQEELSKALEIFLSLLE